MGIFGAVRWATLGSRGSSIYRNKPPFSIFGVGPYTFAPWKIAISGFYKRLMFVRVGPVDGKPVVLDGTINFLPCTCEAEADFLAGILTSEPATEFFYSMVSWDEKRPITVELLRRLSLRKLSAELGMAKNMNSLARHHSPCFSRERVVAPWRSEVYFSSTLPVCRCPLCCPMTISAKSPLATGKGRWAGGVGPCRLTVSPAASPYVEDV